VMFRHGAKGKVALRSLRIPGRESSPASFRDRTEKRSGPRGLHRPRSTALAADAAPEGVNVPAANCRSVLSSPGGHARFDSACLRSSASELGLRSGVPRSIGGKIPTQSALQWTVLEQPLGVILQGSRPSSFLSSVRFQAAGSLLHRQIASSRASSKVRSAITTVEAVDWHHRPSTRFSPRAGAGLRAWKQRSRAGSGPGRCEVASAGRRLRCAATRHYQNRLWLS